MKEDYCYENTELKRLKKYIKVRKAYKKLTKKGMVNTMVYLFLADGFETIEALTVVDMVRRAKIDIETVSIQETKQVVSAHQIPVTADRVLDDVVDQDADMYVFPGGMPGTTNLRANETLMGMLQKQRDANKYIAAICAAPALIFENMGYLKGKKATCYPSFDDQLKNGGVDWSPEGAVIDGNIITGRGMGTAIDFASAIISVLASKEKAKEIEDSIVYKK